MRLTKITALAGGRAPTMAQTGVRGLRKRTLLTLVTLLSVSGALVAVPASAGATPPKGGDQRFHNPQGVISRAQAQVVGAASTATITRDAVLSRAQDWVNQNVPYNQGVYKAANSAPVGPYRTDCSGFISMAWGLSSSLTTQTLPGVSTQITTAALQSGDVLDYNSTIDSTNGSHVVMFVNWADNAHTQYVGMEEAGSRGAVKRTIPYPYDPVMDGSGSWIPYRYNNIVANPVPLIVTTPAVVSGPDGVLHSVEVGPNNSLYSYWQTPGQPWSGPLGVTGNQAYGAPAMTVTSAGTLQLAVRGPGNSLYQFWHAPGQPWAGPLQISSNQAYGEPAITVTPSSNLLDVVVQGSSHNLLHYWQTPGQPWSGPLGVSGDQAYGTPAMTVTSAGTLQLAVRGPGNSLYQFWYVRGQPWAGPLQISNQAY
jgi:hypothetical protein